MRKQLMATTAVAALILGGIPALAQDQPQDPAAQPIPPAGEAPAEMQGAPVTGEPGAAATPDSDAPAASDMAETMPAGGGEMFIVSQEPQQALANEMIGAQLLGPDDAAIGSVSDLVLDEERKVIAAVVGVGGFLGLGQKDVAIAIDQIDEVSSETGQVVFRVDATKEVLEQAPEFVTVAEQQAEVPAVPPAGSATPGLAPAPAEPPATAQ